MTSKAELQAEIRRLRVNLDGARQTATTANSRFESRRAEANRLHARNSDLTTRLSIANDRATRAELRAQEAEAKLKAIDALQHPEPKFGTLKIKIEPDASAMTEQINDLTRRAYYDIFRSNEQRLEDELIKIGWNPPLGSSAYVRHQKLKELREEEARRLADPRYSDFYNWGRGIRFPGLPLT